MSSRRPSRKPLAWIPQGLGEKVILQPHLSVPTNWALASNGGTASASSSHVSGNFPPSAVNNGDRKGLNWGAGGGWNDATQDIFPDWIQVLFAAQKSIKEIDVFTLQDNYASPSDPTLAMTFTLYGITDFLVQTYDGTTWTTVPGGTIVGTNKVWTQVILSSAIACQGVRLWITNVSSGSTRFSRLTELEAWGFQ